MSNALMVYELVAQMFYRDTGHLAPEKSTPLESWQPTGEELQREFDEWRKRNRRHVAAVHDILDNGDD